MAIVKEWLTSAVGDAKDPRLNQVLGGTTLEEEDLTTYWTDPNQFMTWWKNNVERKSKHGDIINNAKSTNKEDRVFMQRYVCFRIFREFAVIQISCLFAVLFSPALWWH